MSIIPLVIKSFETPFVLSGTPANVQNLTIGNNLSGYISLKGPIGQTSLKGINAFVAGQPNSNETIVAAIVPYDFNLDNLQAKALNAAGANSVFDVAVDGSSIGTITFSIGQTVGTFALTATEILENSLFTITAPAIQDPNLSDIVFLLANDI